MNVILHPVFRRLLTKLMQCENPKTHDQIFIGAIQVEIEGDSVTLSMEEQVWETPDGHAIDTSHMRGSDE